MIETERLVLRLPRPSDRAAMIRMVSNPAVMANIGPAMDVAGTDALLAKHDADRWEGLGFWIVERRDDGAFLGFCGLKRAGKDTPFAGEFEAGWTIDQPYWRNGYAFEAAQAALVWGWAHTTAERVIAMTREVNITSQRLMDRLGMYRLPDGDFEHTVIAPDSPLRRTITFAIDRPA